MAIGSGSLRAHFLWGCRARERERRILRWPDVGYRHARKFFAGIPVLPDRRGVHREEHQRLGVHDEEWDGILLEQEPMPLLALAHHRLGPQALGIVSNDSRVGLDVPEGASM